MELFLELLQQAGGFWKYPGRGRYLARLASGKVSDCYANSTPLLVNPQLLPKVVALWRGQINVNSQVANLVIGPAMGGITLAYELARQMPNATAAYSEPYYTVSAEAVALMYPGINQGALDTLLTQNKMTEKAGQLFSRFELPASRTDVYFVEDVITTGESTVEMIEAVLKSIAKKPQATDGAVLQPNILCLIDRRPDPTQPIIANGLKFGVKALASITAGVWKTIEEAKVVHPEVIDAVKPKANWKQLSEG